MLGDRRDHLLRRGLREQRALRQGGAQIDEPCLDRIGSQQFVDEADSMRFGRVDQVAGEQQSLGGRTEQPHRPFERRGRVDDAQLGGRDAEARAGDRQPEVAVDRYCAAPSDAVALHHRDGGLGQHRQRMLGGHVGVHERRRARRPIRQQLGDVGAGAEVVACTAQHHHSHRSIGSKPMTRGTQRQPHVVGDGIALARSVERDGADGPIDGDEQIRQRRAAGAHAPTCASNSASRARKRAGSTRCR